MKMKVFAIAFAALLALAAGVPVTQVGTPEAEVKLPAEPEQSPPTTATESLKDEALTQVMSFISEMAQPMSSEEHDALKDIIQTGGEILMQAEKKAREMNDRIETQNLMQTGSEAGFFGINADGTIDANVAADQMTQLLSKIAAPSNPLTHEEEHVLHDLISGFANAFAPNAETTKALHGDFEKIVDSLLPVKGGDEKLGVTNLISMMSEDHHAFNANILSDLTSKFLDSMEKQFDEQQHGQ